MLQILCLEFASPSRIREHNYCHKQKKMKLFPKAYFSFKVKSTNRSDFLRCIRPIWNVERVHAQSVLINTHLVLLLLGARSVAVIDDRDPPTFTSFCRPEKVCCGHWAPRYRIIQPLQIRESLLATVPPVTFSPCYDFSFQFFYPVNVVYEGHLSPNSF